MKRSFKMLELDCANCAAKMENAINKLEGVHTAKISFMAQRITIDAEDNQFQDVLESANKICNRIHSGCSIMY